MHQSRLESLVESFVNILIGGAVALASQYVVFPIYDIHVEFGAHLGITALFTVVSVVRSYTIRRWFNGGVHKMAVKLVRRLV